MSAQSLAGLDLEDLTPKQLRKILNGVARSQLPYSKKTKEEQDEDKDEAADESDALTKLHREKKGDSKPPKVLADDLPIGGGEDDEEEEQIANKKKKV
jgi:hypothetical protein